MTFLHQLMFETPQLKEFISRTPKFKARDEARVTFSDKDVSVTFPKTNDGVLALVFVCGLLDLHLPSLVEVCRLWFPQALIPAVEHLYICVLEGVLWDWPDDSDSDSWLELLRPFIAVKDLYMSCGITPCIAHALQELVEEGVTEVLPSLQTLFLEEPLPSGLAQEIIDKFISARQLSGHPIAVSCWERKART
jgi:hypothetical protein